MTIEKIEKLLNKTLHNHLTKIEDKLLKEYSNDWEFYAAYKRYFFRRFGNRPRKWEKHFPIMERSRKVFEIDYDLLTHEDDKIIDEYTKKAIEREKKKHEALFRKRMQIVNEINKRIANNKVTEEEIYENTRISADYLTRKMNSEQISEFERKRGVAAGKKMFEQTGLDILIERERERERED